MPHVLFLVENRPWTVPTNFLNGVMHFSIEKLVPDLFRSPEGRFVASRQTPRKPYTRRPYATNQPYAAYAYAANPQGLTAYGMGQPWLGDGSW